MQTPIQKVLELYPNISTEDAAELIEIEKQIIVKAVDDTINVMIGAGFSVPATAKTDMGEIYYRMNYFNNEASI